jgi:3-hydroxybutyryl-CoA dehydrogenase
MGGGIAQVAAVAGFDVLLYDLSPEALERARGRMADFLARAVEKGRMTAAEREAALGRVAVTDRLTGLAACDLVIEAAPEDLELKRGLFRELDAICRPAAILATNTSSLSVSEIGALTGRPERLVGLHFFNPAPLMPLVEVIAGSQTAQATADAAFDLVVRLGKTPVRAKDTPGFIVNRVNRPFPGEALRIVGENVAGVAQVDRIMRLAAGFRMGPFELMDLVGLDVNFAVNQSVFRQFFEEPRFRPHPIQARMVQAGLLGQKTGQGFYRYEGGRIMGGPVGPSPESGPQVESRVWIDGDRWREAARTAGCRLAAEPAGADLVLVEAVLRPTTEAAAAFDRPERVVGSGALPGARLVTVAPGMRTAPEAWQEAFRFFRSLGLDVEVTHDGTGLVAERILCCVINEAAWALTEGVASREHIDTAMKLGTGYPLGPLEWADRIGVARVLGVLEALQRDLGEDRYRPAPLLRRLAAAGLSFGALMHG